MTDELIFLKLGGSLITNKNKAKTALPDRIKTAAEDIAEVLKQKPHMRLLLGHGSGSFGHFAAKKYGTRQGVESEADWLGFAEVWADANQLHQIVMKALIEQNLPVVSMAPSSSAVANQGAIEAWNTAPIQAALDAKLIPMVYGDVVFDRAQGGGILSTEELFLYLSNALQPKRILLAANEAVYADFPKNKKVLPEIGPFNYADFEDRLSGGEGSDITGGMLSKVKAALEMSKIISHIHQDSEVRIFSGKDNGAIKKALLAEAPGTLVSAKT